MANWYAHDMTTAAEWTAKDITTANGGGPTGRIMSSLAGPGGLAASGGIAGKGGGLAG